ncbi:MAG: hypothetical protein K9J37_11805 [Saprospiraceae bacterium]|nr:hypothetical protein [Saprospiraceae bacterium]MCF8250592.1 hypothetical protein [Saprospiraceae bacterium]MCF8281408.1 hypothetical protein [Bacteroidales bacterium]MCF8313089.1 hypothetical protein [Saprospiraceae bacterium]MCF8441547.1 hypothetical protein [Saprospiraceae bacterium]
METKLTFNSYGLLTPAEAITADLDTLKTHFVDAFPKSKTRGKLFENLVRFNEMLQKEVFPWYEMWVNGSFATKKHNPKDVDVVVFLDSEVFALRRLEIDRISRTLFENSRIDAYFVKVLTEGKKGYLRYVLNRRYWQTLFVTNRGRIQKGFLKLTFTNKLD